MKKTCQNCNIEFHANHNRTVYCSPECKAEIRFKKKQEKIISNGIEGIDYVIDQWNGYATPRIYGQWMSSMHPGKTTDDYLKDFPGAPLCCEKDHIATSKNSGKHMKKPKYRKMASDQIKGVNNPNHKSKTTKEQRQARSPFSENFISYESPEDARRFQLEHCSKGRYNTRLSYWIEEGHSPEEAIKMLKERQATFSLDKCIEKYGKEKGQQVFQRRQKKWLASLHENFIQEGDGRSPSSQFANSTMAVLLPVSLLIASFKPSADCYKSKSPLKKSTSGTDLLAWPIAMTSLLSMRKRSLNLMATIGTAILSSMRPIISIRINR